uniref:ARAD1A05698p n=1 Tax=Blastobotrys adeninivorans TaxID=409370 RepID=A0A060SWK2_BLAAD
MANALSIVLKGIKKTLGAVPVGTDDGPEIAVKEEARDEPKDKLVSETPGVPKPAHPRTVNNEESADARPARRKSRSLRSQDSNDYNGAQLFKFDPNYTGVDYGKPLKLVSRKPLPAKEELIESNDTSNEMTEGIDQVTIRKSAPKMSATTRDPLPDELYIVIHRRRQREERRLQILEKDKNAMEMDRLASYLEKLHSPLWRKEIGKITYIRDMNDCAELDKMKELTIKEIEAYLERYKQWRQREREGPPPEQDYKSEEVELENDLKRQARNLKRKSQAPLPEPKKFESFFENRTRRLNFDQVISGRSGRRSLDYAFGRPIPHLRQVPFDIPESWKNREGVCDNENIDTNNSSNQTDVNGSSSA